MKIPFFILFCCYLSTYSQEKEYYSYKEVEEKPKFQQCAHISKEEQLKCFKQQIDKHIQEKVDALFPKGYERPPYIGKANISFIIQPNGTIKILNVSATDESLKNEAKRIILSLPHFIPAKHNGTPVPVGIMYIIDFNRQY
nr:energy transducer TonB [uncultured Capnocytophaga sp.]